MDVLILGGTVFLGRLTAMQALAAGHRVTVFHRGRSGPTPDGATEIRGDRTAGADLDALAQQRFDLVVDTSGYVPAEVGLAARALAGSVGHYAFVSSVSAYPGWPDDPGYHQRGAHDGHADATRDTVPEAVPGWQHYGWLKVGCERAVEQALGERRTTVLRAGAVVGPHDSAVGRLPWWIDRAARGGEMLVPGHPDDPLALIDGRDLADFALTGVPGVFECGGPTGRDTWGGFVAALAAATTKDVADDTVVPTWVDAGWLAGQDVEPWTQVPLWAGPDATGTWAHDNSAAVSAGLRWRPLAETVRDTRVWQVALPEAWTPSTSTPGLSPDSERELLDTWNRRS